MPLTRTTSRLALVAAAVLVLASACSKSDSTAGTPAHDMSPSIPSVSPGGTWSPKSGQLFKEPETFVSKDGRLEATLTIAQEEADVAGQPVREIKTYNGNFGGPTLVVKPGDTISLELVNGLTEETNLHFHGFHVSPEGESDNIFRHVEPGESAHYELVLPEDHEQGLFWYHSHAHGISEGQVAAGLSGLIQIGNVGDLLPYQDTDLVAHDFAIRDLAPKGNVAPLSDSTFGDDQTFLVNGQFQPVLSMHPGETQLWRIGNVGADQFYDLKMDGGVTFHVVGEDGNPVGEVWSTKTLVMPPGKRFEVLVTAPIGVGTYKLSTVKYDQGAMTMPNRELVSVNVTGNRGKTLPIPKTVGAFEDLSDAEIAAKHTETFSFAPGKEFKPEINGKLFDPERVDVTSKLGTVEEWTLRNTTDEQHPFHIHVNDFQVMSVNGKPYDAKGFQDTVLIPAGGEVVIRMPFDDYAGRFVFHCHILGHEDAGMMAVVNVVK